MTVTTDSRKTGVHDAAFSRDSAGFPTGLATTEGRPASLGTHVPAVILGDSIGSRNRTRSTISTYSALGGWNWANWMLGSPFVVVKNLSWGGDVTRSILSRIHAVPSNAQAVFLLAGTNDVQNMSAAANQATIDSTYTAVSSYLQAGVAALVAAGKTVVIATIPPNNAYTPSTDSRIQLLDRLNTFIASLASEYVFVADVFALMWDSAQPTVRVAKTGHLNADNVHPTNLGSYYFGKAAKAGLRSAFAKCLPTVDLYKNFSLARQLYTTMRSGTGGDAAVKTNGTGTLADGWRSINNVGTATFALSNATAYSVSTEYVGEAANAPADIDAYWQEFNITAAAASDNPRLRLPSGTSIASSGGYPDDIRGGDEVFMEVDALVASPVNLKTVSASLVAFFTAGTSPADQPYQGTTYNQATAGSTADYSSAEQPYDEGFRVLLRTPVVRVPENINATAAVTLDLNIDMVFSGVGSANVKFGRVRIWHRSACDM